MVKTWDKKTDRSKLTSVFELKRSRERLDCNCRDKDYIEAIRKKHFPFVPSPNFATIYKRKTNNVSTDKKLKGVRNIVGKFISFFLFNQLRSYFSNDSLLIENTEKGTTDSASDSSVDDSWIVDEDGTLPDKEDDTEVVVKGFTPINNAEQYVEVSDMSNNLSSMYLRNSGNSGGVKRYSITKDHIYMIYDFMKDRKHYCIVYIFVPSMGRDKFTPKVMPGGNKLSIGMVSPKFFFQYDMLKMANMLNVGFNENLHKATAFEKASRDMRRELKVKKGGEVSGEDIIIPLPFRCDQHIVRWGYPLVREQGS